jgi:hypothetical protein
MVYRAMPTNCEAAMIHPAVIERQRERAERRNSERPSLRIPVVELDPRPDEDQPDEARQRRGCEIIDFSI